MISTSVHPRVSSGPREVKPLPKSERYQADYLKKVIAEGLGRTVRSTYSPTPRLASLPFPTVHYGEATGGGRAATPEQSNRANEVRETMQADSVDVGRATLPDRQPREEEQRCRYRRRLCVRPKRSTPTLPQLRTRQRAAALRNGLQPITEVFTKKGTTSVHGHRAIRARRLLTPNRSSRLAAKSHYVAPGKKSMI